MQHPELGMKILDHVAEEVSDVAKVEATPKIDGRNMVMVLAPDKTKKPVTKSKTQAASVAPAPGAETPAVEVAVPEAAEPRPAEPEGTEVSNIASPTA